MPKTVQRPVFDPNRFYSDRTIAEILDAPPGRVRRWIREGRFPSDDVVELPQGRRVRGSALNQYLAEHSG